MANRGRQRFGVFLSPGDPTHMAQPGVDECELGADAVGGHPLRLFVREVVVGEQLGQERGPA
ncbi:MAG TPA: hypothetical protein VE057_26025 [Archangium sp.]|nr:hypothetical protein [Archangium sp.]